MVTTFLDEVVKRHICYHIWVGIYLVWLVAIDISPKGSNANAICITISGNVFVTR